MQIGIGIDIPRGGSGVTEVAPENSIAPVASGNVWVGSTLSTTDGTWEPTPDSYTYQWQRDGADISSATNATYTLVAADATKAIRCVVTATKGSKSASANSNAITVDAYDEDASAYLAAVVAAEAAVSLAQRRAVTTFVAGEKTASRWTSVKRFYLPIWGAAEPNAIDMVTRASGTFNGTVAHNLGPYFKGNGSDGYFATPADSTPTLLGLSYQSTGMGVLAATAPTATNKRFGGAQTSTRGIDVEINATGPMVRGNSYVNSGGLVQELAAMTGVFFASRDSSTAFRIHQRKAAGETVTDDATTEISDGTITNTFVFGARNASGTISGWTDAGLGACFVTLGMTSTNGTAFTLSVKTLWEACTGLTLP